MRGACRPPVPVLAVRTSEDPETGRTAEQPGVLCVGGRVYTNCDLVDARELT
ncbi:hypothetical protein GCM10023086_66490 [Streptomyces venetus]|uniref:Uncharacterized protein n=1 Tax=Streptomyces venetus TaxID=1701086 RepID=A0ABP8H576_9ACTN